jgi:putative hydrolase of the HAD superfamily
MLRAVLFDLDDTLFDHAGCARDALTAVQNCHESLRAMRFDVLERTHSTLLEQLHKDVMFGRVPLEEARRQRFLRLLAACGVETADAAAAELAATYRDTYRESRRSLAGAAGLLAAVRQRAARVGIVSNNLLEEQLDKLRTCGLESFVDALVVSEDVGVSKPDPGIFRVALDRLEIAPAEAVMVGDSWSADVLGARAAGIRAVWFNPGRVPPPDDDAAIAQLHGLEPVAEAMRIIFDAHRD